MLHLEKGQVDRSVRRVKIIDVRFCFDVFLLPGVLVLITLGF